MTFLEPGISRLWAPQSSRFAPPQAGVKEAANAAMEAEAQHRHQSMRKACSQKHIKRLYNGSVRAPIGLKK